jgi:hypothetical protein
MKKINLFFIFIFVCGLSHMNHAMHKLPILQSNHIKTLETKNDKSVKLWVDDSYFDNPNFFQTPCEPVSKFDTRLIKIANKAMNIASYMSTFMHHFSNAFSEDHTFIKLTKRRAEDKKRKLRCYRRYMKKLSTEKKGMVKARL